MPFTELRPMGLLAKPSTRLIPEEDSSRTAHASPRSPPKGIWNGHGLFPSPHTSAATNGYGMSSNLRPKSAADLVRAAVGEPMLGEKVRNRALPPNPNPNPPFPGTPPHSLTVALLYSRWQGMRRS
jgi:hypothetical protein